MDEKPGVMVWKWSRFSRFLVWKWMKNRVFWFGNGHVFPNFGLEMDEKLGVFGLEMVTFFPNFSLEMDEKPGVFDAPKRGTPHGECINTVLMRLTMRGDLCVGERPVCGGGYLLQRLKKSMASSSLRSCASSLSVMFWKGVRLGPRSRPMSFMIRLPPTMLPRKWQMTSMTSCA